MNGCNDCKFKRSFNCMSPAATFTVFDKDKGVQVVHQSSRSWHRGDLEHCRSHEPAGPTILERIKAVLF